MVVQKSYKCKEEELIPPLKASCQDLYKTCYIMAEALRLIRTSGYSSSIIFAWNSKEASEASQFHYAVQPP